MVKLEFWQLYAVVQTSLQSRYRTFLPKSFFLLLCSYFPYFTPRNHWSNLHDYNFALLEFQLMDSYYSIQSLVSGFFHIAKCFLNSLILLHVKKSCSILLSRNSLHNSVWQKFTVTQFVHLFTSWWTFGLYPVWGYYE